MRSASSSEVESKRREIISYIRKYIMEHDLTENDKIPSENCLAERFSTNRNTVRSALATLKSQGIIYSCKGKGFFVSGRPNPLVYKHENSLGFSEILNKGTKNFTSKVLSVELRSPCEKDMDMLKIGRGEQVYYLRQLRTIGGQKLAVCLSVIPEKFVPGLEKHMEPYSGTNNIFMNTYHLPHPACTWVRLEASLPTSSEARILEIPDNMPILQQENVFAITDMGPVEYFVVRARGDIFHFAMEFT
ncbi:MAG: GntR family transcriptional regulator [Lachnospiraceae bacterium]